MGKPLTGFVVLLALALLTSACGQSASEMPTPTPEEGVIVLPDQTVAPGDSSIILMISVPEGYKFNENAPFTVEWTVDGDAIQIDPGHQNARVRGPSFPMGFHAVLSEGEATLNGSLSIFYCTLDETQCFADMTEVRTHVTVQSGAPEEEIMVSYEVVPPTQEE